MRRSLILSTILAVSTAVLGACTPTGTNNGTVTPNKVTTPTPVVTASPTASPEVKGKTDGKNGKDPAALGNDAHPANDGKIKEPKPAITPALKAK